MNLKVKRVAVGADHRGFDLKRRIVKHLREKGVEVEDVGTSGSDSVDYVDFAAPVARLVATDKAERGILICASGIGMSITANKIVGVRAALVQNRTAAQASREHNNANILCLGADYLLEDDVEGLVDLWLCTPFAGGRHARRVQKITDVEREGLCR